MMANIFLFLEYLFAGICRYILTDTLFIHHVYCVKLLLVATNDTKNYQLTISGISDLQDYGFIHFNS